MLTLPPSCRTALCERSESAFALLPPSSNTGGNSSGYSYPLTMPETRKGLPALSLFLFFESSPFLVIIYLVSIWYYKEGSGMESVGKGFWFALGFTPVFVVICFFSSIIIDHIESNGYFSIQWPLQSRIDAQFARALDRSFQTVSVTSAPPRVASAPAPVPVAVVANRQLSDAEKREQQCSLLVLKYADTQDLATKLTIKKQIYDVCPH